MEASGTQSIPWGSKGSETLSINYLTANTW